MTSADPFTKASPHYVAAMRHCDKTGDAFEVTGGNPAGLLAAFGLIALAAFVVGFAGYFVWFLVSHPWGA